MANKNYLPAEGRKPDTGAIYREEWRFFRKRLLKFFAISAALYFFSALAGYVIFLLNPDFAISSYDMIRANFERRGFLGIEGRLSLFALILSNNIIASLVSIASGIMPFVFLPGWIIVSNGFLLGLVEAVLVLKKAGVYVSVFSILPHGLLELPALFYSGALGIYLSVVISKRILGVRSAEGVAEAFSLVARHFVFVVFPLLVAAAFIEAFVTYAIVR